MLYWKGCVLFFFFGLPQFTHIHIYTYIHLACKYLIIIDYRLIRVLFMPEDYINHMLSYYRKPGKSNVSNDCKIISGCCFTLWLFVSYEITSSRISNQKGVVNLLPMSFEYCRALVMPEAQLALVSMTVALEAEQNLEFMPMIKQAQAALWDVRDAWFGVWG